MIFWGEVSHSDELSDTTIGHEQEWRILSDCLDRIIDAKGWNCAASSVETMKQLASRYTNAQRCLHLDAIAPGMEVPAIPACGESLFTEFSGEYGIL